MTKPNLEQSIRDYRPRNTENADSCGIPETLDSESTTVVVSGIGAVSAAGNDVQTNLDNMLAATRTPSTAPTIFECDFNRPVFECAPDLSLDEKLRSERTFALAMKSLDEALSDANLAESDLAGPRVGVALGSTVACMLNSMDFYSDVRAGNSPDLSPLDTYLHGDLSERVAAKLGATGPRATIANACSSGANAITMAFSWLKAGLCDIVVAGGADELSLIPYCGFNSLQIMGSEPCTPFDADRKGLTLGEGAGILILETESSAKQRGAIPKAVLAACGCASDAHHLTGPHPEGQGLKSAVAQALNAAEVSPDQVDYVNAHGTATPDNDRIEGSALFDIFGDSLRYSSTKYYTGHTLAAAGAIEAALCVAGLNRGVFPGTPLKTPDPNIPIPPTSASIPHNGGLALSTSMAFGGTCVALLFAPSTNQLENQGERPTTTTTTITKTSIRSVGVIGPFGRGVDALRAAMSQSESQTNESNTPRLAPTEIFKAPEFKKLRRRADKISLMALAAASEAVKSANLAEFDIANMAVIFATAFGAHTATFKFLDSLLDYGHGAPSPTSFSNSVHNAPTFHITKELGIHGPSTTMTAFKSPFAKAMQYAESILLAGQAEKVLVVAGDEVDQTMLRISDLWFQSLEKPAPGWGEGAVAFILEKNPRESASSAETESSLMQVVDSSARFADQAEQLFGHTLLNDAFATALLRLTNSQA